MRTKADELIKQCAYYILSRQTTRASLNDTQVFQEQSPLIGNRLTTMGDMLGSLFQGLTNIETTLLIKGNCLVIKINPLCALPVAIAIKCYANIRGFANKNVITRLLH